MWTFTTEVDMDIIGDHVTEPASGKIDIKWQLDLEMREYGVKSFSITVPDQEITATVTKYNEETDEEYEEDITVKLENVETELNTNGHYDSLYPDRLEIHMNRATLEFS